MHDVHRDSLIAKGKKRKVKKSDHVHSPDEHAPSPVVDHDHGAHQHDAHDHDSGHAHKHEEKDHAVHSHEEHSHDHDAPHGHSHDHDEGAYEEHDHDLHIHDHGQEHKHAEGRAIAHMHEHGHDFFHAHHHTHHPEHAGVIHKVFGDPVRDWFSVFLMALLIVTGYLKWLPGYLSDGMLICAAVIGLFPIVKNGLFDSIYKKTLRFELLLGILLLSGLFMGKFLEVALITLLLLMGSFMRLNFSWKD